MAISGTTDNAVYNSRIAGMLTPSFFRRSRFALIFPILLLAATARGQNWTGAEEQLAAKIVAVTGQRTMAVEVSNRASLAQFPSATSDLNAATVDEIRRGLLTQLAASGARFVNIEQAAATVRIALSESLQNYVWVAEIRLGSDPDSNSASNPPSNQSSNQASSVEPVVVMVSWPRPATRTTEPEAAPMALHKTSLWSQPERILDAVVVDGNPARMVVLDVRGVTSYRMQDGRWQSEQSFAVAHSRPWPRDLRGRIELRKDHLFDVYLPGVFCRSTTLSPLAMSCSEGDNMWPIGTSVFNLNAAFVPSRNYFGGALLPGVGKQMATVPFYSAAAFPRGQSTLWLFAAVDGQVHVLDGTTDQVTGNLGWGSDIASIRSGCGSGSQLLATGRGDGPNDTVRGFEISDHEPVAVTAPLDIKGSITALWTESGETGVLAIVRNSETGSYEALRINLTCSR